MPGRHRHSPPRRLGSLRRRRVLVPLLAAATVASALPLTRTGIAGTAITTILRMATSSAGDPTPAATVAAVPTLPRTDPTPRSATADATPPATASTPAVPSTTSSTMSSSRHGIACTGPGDAAAAATARRLQDALAAALARSTARVGAAAFDWGTGVSCSYHGATTFHSASIIKVTTLATLLWQAQQAGRSLTATEQEWAEDAITRSDNDAQSALWSRAGGAAGVQRFLRAAGMSHTTAASGGLWGLTRVTATDQVKLLRLLAHSGLLTQASRRYEVGLMRSVIAEQRWGVTAGAPPGTTVALKNGWLPESSGAWHVNSIGYVTGSGHEYALAVLSDGSSSMDAGIGAVQTLARALNSALT